MGQFLDNRNFVNGTILVIFVHCVMYFFPGHFVVFIGKQQSMTCYILVQVVSAFNQGQFLSLEQSLVRVVDPSYSCVLSPPPI